MSGVYYNEIEPSAILWLQAAMDAGIIAKGEIDSRSIEDVRPNELMGFTQCHFFAGIGGWSIALRLAGWPDDRPVWTGSCPCQSFSTAGKGLGRDDPRHLWPSWFWLIQQCRPSAIFGEQVANAITHGWWDDVASDLEAEGYTCGAKVLPACSVGRPHKRDRLWFVANAYGRGHEQTPLDRQYREKYHTQPRSIVGNPESKCRGVERQNEWAHGAKINSFANTGWAGGGNSEPRYGVSAAEHVANTERQRQQGQGAVGESMCAAQVSDGEADRAFHAGAGLQWIDCPDGKQRLIEPSICLLVDGLPSRLRKAALHGFGNAIPPEVAAEFIKATQQR